MDHLQADPVAVAVAFIDRINHGDGDGIAALIGDGYVLTVFDESPEEGRELGIEGWRGYLTAFPRYLVIPRRIAVNGEIVAVLAHTTGSHLDLPDGEERALTFIILATVREGLVRGWTLIEDTPAARAAHGLG
jgi:hypothetical protein